MPTSSELECVARESVWLDKRKYEEAERQFHEQQQQQVAPKSPVAVDQNIPINPTSSSNVTKMSKSARKQQKQQQSMTDQQSTAGMAPIKQQRESEERALDLGNPSSTELNLSITGNSATSMTAAEGVPKQASKNKEKRSKKAGDTNKGEQQQQGKSKEKSSKTTTAKNKVTTDKKPAADQPECNVNAGNGSSSILVDEISRARQHIKNSLQCPVSVKSSTAGSQETPAELHKKIAELETETNKLNKVTDDLRALVLKLETRVLSLEKCCPSEAVSKKGPSTTEVPSKKVKEEAKKEEDDDDVDLFGSDEEAKDTDEKKRQRQERLQAYESKKSKKPAVIAKSNIILDVKPWDDETDLQLLEKQVRTVTLDGLVWGASKLVPLAYGIHKLQISCVVEDEKVSVDDLQEQIEGFDELVQSVDIAAFNKV